MFGKKKGVERDLFETSCTNGVEVERFQRTQRLVCIRIDFYAGKLK